VGGGQDRDAIAAPSARREEVSESATAEAPPAIANAVVDALAHLGVRHIDISDYAGEGVEDFEGEGGGGVGALWSPETSPARSDLRF
jgi:hypothetical protein